MTLRTLPQTNRTTVTVAPAKGLAWLTAGLAASALVTLAGCTVAPKGKTLDKGTITRPTATIPATAEREAATLGFVKSLAGTWQMTDEKGAVSVSNVFAVTSNGAVVREIMFPGSPHEMTNTYHMDGDDLLVTHYCAVGNQPRMHCVRSTPTELVFVYDSITNFSGKEGTTYMAELTLTKVDADTLKQTWHHWTMGPDGVGKRSGEPTEFEVKRQK